MDAWRFHFTVLGQKEFDSLDSSVQKKIAKKLLWFRDNFDSVTPFPLDGEWRGFFKLRVGEWRVVYEVDQKGREVFVHVIDLRERIYKRTPPRFERAFPGK